MRLIPVEVIEGITDTYIKPLITFLNLADKDGVFYIDTKFLEVYNNAHSHNTFPVDKVLTKMINLGIVSHLNDNMYILNFPVVEMDYKIKPTVFVDDSVRVYRDGKIEKPTMNITLNTTLFDQKKMSVKPILVGGNLYDHIKPKMSDELNGFSKGLNITGVTTQSKGESLKVKTGHSVSDTVKSKIDNVCENPFVS